MVYTKKDISWLLKAECGARLFSTCAKRFYMAIVVDANGFQVSDGYNGSASGTVHCVNGGCPRALENSQSGSSYNNCIAIHAESNCLMRSDAHRTVGSTLYVNGSPCHDCAKLIAGSKVARLVCLNDTAYSSWEDKSKPYLLDVGVEVVDIPMEQFYTDHVRPIRGLSLERPQAQHISSET